MGSRHTIFPLFVTVVVAPSCTTFREVRTTVVMFIFLYAVFCEMLFENNFDLADEFFLFNIRRLYTGCIHGIINHPSSMPPTLGVVNANAFEVVY